MSSIIRARSGLTARSERVEGIGGSSLELKVAGPSMLGIGCPDRHPLPLIHSPPPTKMHPPRRRPPARAGSFHAPFRSLPDAGLDGMRSCHSLARLGLAEMCQEPERTRETDRFQPLRPTSVEHKPAHSRQSAEIASCLKAGVVKGHGALYVFFPLRPALFLAVADIGL